MTDEVVTYTRRIIPETASSFVVPSADIVTGLVLKLGCHDGAGGSVTDQSGFGRNFSISGGLLWDGTTGWESQTGFAFASRAHESWMEFTNQLTVFLWQKAYNGLATDGYCLSEWNSAGGNVFLITGDSGPLRDKLRVILSSDGTTNDKLYISSITAVSTSAYNSIAFVYNTNSLKLYVNGAPDPSPDTSGGNNAISSLKISTADMGLGCINPPAATAVDMAIRDVYVYNVAKTDADIAALHALG